MTREQFNALVLLMAEMVLTHKQYSGSVMFSSMLCSHARYAIDSAREVCVTEAKDER